MKVVDYSVMEVSEKDFYLDKQFALVVDETQLTKMISMDW